MDSKCDSHHAGNLYCVCGVGNCEYSSKYNAYVTKHRQQAHQTHVVLDQSAMDRSVSYSEVFDTTASTGSLGEKTSQELYDAMAKAPSSTLKCVQTVDRRRKRSKEEEYEGREKDGEWVRQKT